MQLVSKMFLPLYQLDWKPWKVKCFSSAPILDLSCVQDAMCSELQLPNQVFRNPSLLQLNYFLLKWFCKGCFAEGR